jgi:hypothetical protein
MTAKVWKDGAMADLNLLLLHLPEKNEEFHDSLSHTNYLKQ